MERKFWYELVDAESGDAFAGTRVASVTLADNKDVDDFSLAVRSAPYNDILLRHVTPAQLIVYQNREIYDGEDRVSLVSSQKIRDFGRTVEDALVVEVPRPKPLPVSTPLPAREPVPSMTILESAADLAKECDSVAEWEIGAVHNIPMIWEFMKALGGCTANGKIYWRLEDHQVLSVVLNGWFGGASNTVDVHKNKKCIVMGSPGIGKSTLLCVLAFYLALTRKKNVLVYRILTNFDEDNCLFYFGFKNNQFVHFQVQQCLHQQAIDIYRQLIDQHRISNVWLLLDGFRYEDIPVGIRSFKFLATSKQVDLKSQDSVGAYCCLLPSWRKADLFTLGQAVFQYQMAEMKERFYYSGGNVREFGRETAEEIRISMQRAINNVTDASSLLSSSANIQSCGYQVDRLRRTFVADFTKPINYEFSGAWEQIVDSEYVALGLSVCLRSDQLLRVYHWARGVGHGALAGAVFEIIVHALASDNALKLFVTKYDRKPASELRHQDLKELSLKTGKRLCCCTSKGLGFRVYADCLKAWSTADKYSYWFPYCHDFPNIDGIIKVRLDDTVECNVAYLQMTVASEHDIDAKHLKTMNKIFHPSSSKKPLYIAVCPDLKSCEALVLKPNNNVLEAQRVCDVYIGYYGVVSWALSGDGRKNNVAPDAVPPAPTYELRKRKRFDDDALD